MVIHFKTYMYVHAYFYELPVQRLAGFFTQAHT